MATLQYDDMREARRQVMAVNDPQAQAALFTVLGLLAQVSEELERVRNDQHHMLRSS